MELPSRTRGDELLRPGELLGLRQRVRRMARQHDMTSVIACAFDHRTRMLPFVYAATHMPPAGVRAIGSAMLDARFEKTRIALQQWNRNSQPSQVRLDGRIPDIFLVSSMQVHSAACEALGRPKTKLHFADATWQLLGMWGLTQTVRRTFGWILRLRFGKIRRKFAPPMNRIPTRAVDGSCASHALPGSIQLGSDEPKPPLTARGAAKAALSVFVST